MPFVLRRSHDVFSDPTLARLMQFPTTMVDSQLVLVLSVGALLLLNGLFGGRLSS